MQENAIKMSTIILSEAIAKGPFTIKLLNQDLYFPPNFKWRFDVLAEIF